MFEAAVCMFDSVCAAGRYNHLSNNRTAETVFSLDKVGIYINIIERYCFCIMLA